MHSLEMIERFTAATPNVETKTAPEKLHRWRTTDDEATPLFFMRTATDPTLSEYGTLIELLTTEMVEFVKLQPTSSIVELETLFASVVRELYPLTLMLRPAIVACATPKARQPRSAVEFNTISPMSDELAA